MKNLRRKRASIPKRRWAAYAAAGAATALAGSNSLEAAIHYSGCLHESIGNFERFPLNPPVSFYLFHFGPGVCEFTINLAALPFRSVVAYNVASTSFYRPYLSKLRWGQNISTAGSIRRLPGSPYYGILELGGQGQWTDRGRGFIGFRWNNGAGFQYGRARITKTRLPEDKIRLEDYAYADPVNRSEPGRSRVTKWFRTRVLLAA